MASYAFLTTWLLESPREPAWEAIADPGSWPAWWPNVKRAEELDHGDADGLGRRYRCTWRSRLPYSVSFEAEVVRAERPGLIEAAATGDLEGMGRWRLLEQDGLTAVLYEWQVRTTKLWMNVAAPIARPIFEVSHDAVMRGGAEGIAAHLGCRLLAFD